MSPSCIPSRHSEQPHRRWRRHAEHAPRRERTRQRLERLLGAVAVASDEVGGDGRLLLSGDVGQQLASVGVVIRPRTSKEPAGTQQQVKRPVFSIHVAHPLEQRVHAAAHVARKQHLDHGCGGGGAAVKGG